MLLAMNPARGNGEMKPVNKAGENGCEEGYD
jgi:hypothetical protein